MNDSLATVHLRVPAEIKARWVKAAQAEGLKLSDWIVRAVAAHLSELPDIERRRTAGQNEA